MVFLEGCSVVGKASIVARTFGDTINLTEPEIDIEAHEGAARIARERASSTSSSV